MARQTHVLCQRAIHLYSNTANDRTVLRATFYFALSHAVLVVNGTGYWGEGTASNICYARIRGCCGCLEVQLGSGLVPLRSAEFQAPVGPVMSGASTTSTVMVPLMVCNGFKGVLNAMHDKIFQFF